MHRSRRRAAMYEDRKGQFKVGYTKRLMELRESQLAEAATIAVEAGVLRRCELHSEITIQFADPSPAYKIANARFTSRAHRRHPDGHRGRAD